MTGNYCPRPTRRIRRSAWPKPLHPCDGVATRSIARACASALRRRARSARGRFTTRTNETGHRVPPADVVLDAAREGVPVEAPSRRRRRCNRARADRAGRRKALAEEPDLRKTKITGTNAALTVAAGASSLKLLDISFLGGHALAGVCVGARPRKLSRSASRPRTRGGFITETALMQVHASMSRRRSCSNRFRIGIGVDVDWLGIRRHDEPECHHSPRVRSSRSRELRRRSPRTSAAACSSRSSIVRQLRIARALRRERRGGRAILTGFGGLSRRPWLRRASRIRDGECAPPGYSAVQDAVPQSALRVRRDHDRDADPARGDDRGRVALAADRPARATCARAHHRRVGLALPDDASDRLRRRRDRASSSSRRLWIQGIAGIATYFGLLSAGIAIALQDLLTNLAGWIFILIRRPFRVGDRIQVGTQHRRRRRHPPVPLHHARGRQLGARRSGHGPHPARAERARCSRTRSRTTTRRSVTSGTSSR